ncbi:uncharacterized protein LOC129582912 [Paramacrobiotus metropolitanus]|uniref:uncharacterized protein LOC129582912 n=1 Tax=Paramacrobiotus metropolitanus TaxID=2943436 RepID=UPI002445F04D|nr:uncharacterized protein LOC129582912 [Paramacrobiotus metropolitanus]
MSQNDLQEYGKFLTSDYIQKAKERGDPLVRKRVIRHGRQADGDTVVFGPETAFRKTEVGDFQRVDLSATEFVWVPGSLPELSVPKTLPPDYDALSFLSSLLPEKTMLGLCMALGGAYAGFHYDVTIANFKRMPD